MSMKNINIYLSLIGFFVGQASMASGYDVHTSRVSDDFNHRSTVQIGNPCVELIIPPSFSTGSIVSHIVDGVMLLMGDLSHKNRYSSENLFFDGNGKIIYTSKKDEDRWNSFYQAFFEAYTNTLIEYGRQLSNHSDNEECMISDQPLRIDDLLQTLKQWLSCLGLNDRQIEDSLKCVERSYHNGKILLSTSSQEIQNFKQKNEIKEQCISGFYNNLNDEITLWKESFSAICVSCMHELGHRIDHRLLINSPENHLEEAFSTLFETLAIFLNKDLNYAKQHREYILQCLFQEYSFMCLLNRIKNGESALLKNEDNSNVELWLCDLAEDESMKRIKGIQEEIKSKMNLSDEQFNANKQLYQNFLKECFKGFYNNLTRHHIDLTQYKVNENAVHIPSETAVDEKNYLASYSLPYMIALDEVVKSLGNVKISDEEMINNFKKNLPMMLNNVAKLNSDIMLGSQIFLQAIQNTPANIATMFEVIRNINDTH